jgi:hypothetical protein
VYRQGFKRRQSLTEESIPTFSWRDGGKLVTETDSKLLSEFPWLIIFKPDITK